MAKGRKRSGVNKSKEIRSTYGLLGEGAKPKEVVSHLAARKIKVTSGLVSNVRHAMLHESGAKKTKKAQAGTKSAANDVVAVSALLEAKRLVKQAGGVAEAKKALDTLAKLEV